MVKRNAQGEAPAARRCVMEERFFPVGIQTFEKIRNRHAIYVDKTGLIYRLVKDCNYVFLSQTRRSSKSA